MSLPNTEAAEEKKAQQIAEEKVAWRKRARQFISAVAGESKEAAMHKPAKRYRTKSFRWLVSTDSALRACSGRGWAHFQQPVDTKAPLDVCAGRL